MQKHSHFPAILKAFEERFIPEPNTGCWIWMGNRFSLKRGGYGCFTMRPAGIRAVRAHRLSWEIYCAAITPAQHVLHRCDNPICVNPDHLFLGDQRSNMDDKVSKARQDRGDQHGMHKLSEQDARAIKADPRKHAEIASQYGVSYVTVSDIKRGRSWRHL